MKVKIRLLTRSTLIETTVPVSSTQEIYKPNDQRGEKMGFARLVSPYLENLVFTDLAKESRVSTSALGMSKDTLAHLLNPAGLIVVSSGHRTSVNLCT